MNQPGTRPALLVSGWKDQPLAVEASSFDAEELRAAPVAVSHRDTDTADHPATKTHCFDHAEILAGEPVSLLGPDIPNPKVHVRRHIATLAIQRSGASQQNGG
jgi:hypothetical protein